MTELTHQADVSGNRGKANMDELIERLEKAVGPDRELDFAVHCRFFPPPIRSEDERIVELPPGFGKDALSQAMDPRPRYTASIDAALALVERVLPGAWWQIRSTGVVWAAVHQPHSKEVDDIIGQAEGRTAPLAILIALLKARALNSESSNGH